jgi:hypothetical protein
MDVLTIGTMSDQDPRRLDVPPDPSGIEAPHDVLAADEFGIGTADARMPPDPHRFEPPHDILAAEEFAMPAGVERHGAPAAAPATGSGRGIAVPALLGAAAALVLLLRRRSHRR